MAIFLLSSHVSATTLFNLYWFTLAAMHTKRFEFDFHPVKVHTVQILNLYLIFCGHTYGETRHDQM